MTEKKGHKPSPKQVLIFNRRRVLTLIAASVNEAAKISNLKPGNISKACLGSIISNGMYYFRYIDAEIEIDLADLGTLRLEEYDKLCGVQRPIYTTMAMNRKNWKYNKNKNV